jgi:hypothetical protein
MVVPGTPLSFRTASVHDHLMPLLNQSGRQAEKHGRGTTRLREVIEEVPYAQRRTPKTIRLNDFLLMTSCQ